VDSIRRTGRERAPIRFIPSRCATLAKNPRVDGAE
jgi:hypothetical protein